MSIPPNWSRSDEDLELLNWNTIYSLYHICPILHEACSCTHPAQSKGKPGTRGMYNNTFLILFVLKHSLLENPPFMSIIVPYYIDAIRTVPWCSHPTLTSNWGVHATPTSPRAAKPSAMPSAVSLAVWAPMKNNLFNHQLWGILPTVCLIVSGQYVLFDSLLRWLTLWDYRCELIFNTSWWHQKMTRPVWLQGFGTSCFFPITMANRTIHFWHQSWPASTFDQVTTNSSHCFPVSIIVYACTFGFAEKKWDESSGDVKYLTHKQGTGQINGTRYPKQKIHHPNPSLALPTSEPPSDSTNIWHPTSRFF